MKKQSTISSLTFAGKTALFTFLYHTLLLLVYLLRPAADGIFMAILFLTLFAILTNCVALIVQLIKLLSEPASYKNTLVDMAALLLNIPIALLYLYITAQSHRFFNF